MIRDRKGLAPDQGLNREKQPLPGVSGEPQVVARLSSSSWGLGTRCCRFTPCLCVCMSVLLGMYACLCLYVCARVCLSARLCVCIAVCVRRRAIKSHSGLPPILESFPLFPALETPVGGLPRSPTPAGTALPQNHPRLSSPTLRSSPLPWGAPSCPGPRLVSTDLLQITLHPDLGAPLTVRAPPLATASPATNPPAT